MRKITFLAVSLVCLAGISVSTSAADYYGVIRGLLLDANSTSAKGNWFYLERTDGTWYVVQRDRVGSLQYDQFLSVAQTSISSTRNTWIGADTTGLGNAKKLTNLNLVGVIYGLAMWGSGYSN